MIFLATVSGDKLVLYKVVESTQSKSYNLNFVELRFQYCHHNGLFKDAVPLDENLITI